MEDLFGSDDEVVITPLNNDPTLFSSFNQNPIFGHQTSPGSSSNRNSESSHVYSNIDDSLPLQQSLAGSSLNSNSLLSHVYSDIDNSQPLHHSNSFSSLNQAQVSGHQSLAGGSLNSNQASTYPEHSFINRETRLNVLASTPKSSGGYSGAIKALIDFSQASSHVPKSIFANSANTSNAGSFCEVKINSNLQTSENTSHNESASSSSTNELQ